MLEVPPTFPFPADCTLPALPKAQLRAWRSSVDARRPRSSARRQQLSCAGFCNPRNARLSISPAPTDFQARISEPSIRPQEQLALEGAGAGRGTHLERRARWWRPPKPQSPEPTNPYPRSTVPAQPSRGWWAPPPHASHLQGAWGCRPRSQVLETYGGFQKIGVPFLGVPIIRIILCWGILKVPYWEQYPHERGIMKQSRGHDPVLVPPW